MKEIEFSKPLNDLVPIKNKLSAAGFKLKRVVNVKREIWKKTNFKYFVKITYSTDKKTDYIFSLKEDLIDKTTNSGLKVAEELDLSVPLQNSESLEEFIKYIGFKINSSFNKKRNSYFNPNFDGLTVDLDTYDTDEGQKYVAEVEGKSKTKVMQVAKKIGITGS